MTFVIGLSNSRHRIVIIAMERKDLKLVNVRHRKRIKNFRPLFTQRKIYR